MSTSLGRPLDRQTMDGDALRPHGHDLPQGIREIRGRLSGKSGDDVAVDVIKAVASGQGEGSANILRAVAPSDGLQGLSLHGLGVDADAVDPPPFEDLQLFSRDGVRTPGFYGKFTQRGKIKGFLYGRDQLVQLSAVRVVGVPPPM